MDTNVPYMMSVKNLHAILNKIQNAGVPEGFGHDFLRDLGFSSSSDRGIIKLLKYLGMLDVAGKPQAAYREFTNHTKGKQVLADRLRSAYDDLFLADKNAHSKTAVDLKGWFKSKTGAGDAVGEKIATTFKALASYADFSKAPETPAPEPNPPKPSAKDEAEIEMPIKLPPGRPPVDFGLVYRLEIHLPDTQNVETYRAIFRAIRAELMG